MSSEDSSMLEKYGKDFPKDHVLFREGDNGKEMYVIVAGKVTISKKIRDREKILVTLPPGEFFGEMSILNNRPRSATATLAEDSKLLVIDPKTFEEMIKKNTEIAVRMIKKLAERLRSADDQIENLMLRDSKSRIVHLLSSLSDSVGKDVEGGKKVSITLREISERANCEMDIVDQISGQLIKQSIITIASDGIIVSDIEKLRKFLEYLSMKEQFGEGPQ